MLQKFSPERKLFDMFAAGVAYLTTSDGTGRPDIGTCFHIGQGVFITAWHVVENRTITKIATTVASTDVTYGSFLPREARDIHGPFFHPNSNYDRAAFRLPDRSVPQIPFYDVVKDGVDTELLLRPVVVMGCPPIPGSKSPILVCAKAEVNATFATYFDDQRVYLVSCLARGGFSGGPALTLPHHCLGVVTRSILRAEMPPELGFMAVVGPIPVLELLHEHRMMPNYSGEQVWEPHTKQKGNQRMQINH